MRRQRGPGPQVAHLFGKVFGRAVGVRVERLGDAHIAARRAAHAEIDAPRRERLQHAELFGHLERAVVRQHHAGAADADAPRAPPPPPSGSRARCRRWSAGRGARSARSARSRAFGVFGERQRVADGGVLAPAGATDWSRMESCSGMLGARSERAASLSHPVNTVALVTNRPGARRLLVYISAPTVLRASHRSFVISAPSTAQRSRPRSKSPARCLRCAERAGTAAHFDLID